MYTHLGTGLKLGVTIIEIPWRSLWPVTETDRDMKFQRDVKGSLKAPCPACPRAPGRLQRLVCQSQRVSYLVKPKMKFCGLSREDGSHLGPREGARTIGRRSKECGVPQAREGSSQQFQLPQRTLGMQGLGLVCTVWAKVQNQRRWLMRKSKQHPDALPKSLAKSLGGGGGPTAYRGLL